MRNLESLDTTPNASSFDLWVYRRPIQEAAGPIFAKKRDGTLVQVQAKTRSDLTAAYAERNQATGGWNISQGIVLQTTLPKGYSQQLYNEEMKRPAAWESSASFGPMRQMADEVERMAEPSAQQMENTANYYMREQYEKEITRLVGEFDDKAAVGGQRQY